MATSRPATSMSVTGFDKAGLSQRAAIAPGGIAIVGGHRAAGVAARVHVGGVSVQQRGALVELGHVAVLPLDAAVVRVAARVVVGDRVGIGAIEAAVLRIEAGTLARQVLGVAL